MQKKINIGLIGFGVVGEGVYHVLQQTPSLQAEVKKIAIKHIHKKRNAPAELFTDDASLVLFDDEIDVIVELIDDAEIAYEIVKTALQLKKHVVSANKKMIADHLNELIALQNENKVSLLYEAAVCGSIPIIRNLEEYYDNDLLLEISGIVNGSTNFILTKMNEQGLRFDEALHQAQELGFAESNPTLDIEGIDAVNKLSILLKHSFGLPILPDQIFRKGITSITSYDNEYACEKGYEIKLIANAVCTHNHEVQAYVLPCLLPKSHALAKVKDEYNGVLLRSKLADEQILIGKGAGRYPTASAVVSDISALRFAYRYEYRKSNRNKPYHFSTNFELDVLISYAKETTIDRTDFISIEERYISDKRCHLKGRISVQKLQQAHRKDEVSVLVFPAKDVNQNSDLFENDNEIAVENALR
ncbi:MAG: homoserine dehydrogenase [Bacteroidetes bacterium]|nr:homoserine dehydrogenase [Bacteroidota bacterium]